MAFLLAGTLFLTGLPATAQTEPAIRVVRQDGVPRYLLEFTLTPANTALTVSWKERPRDLGEENKYAFGEGGQFEVFIRREYFPVQIPASCCDSYLILQMPYTNPGLPGGAAAITEKRRLFDRLATLARPDAPPVTVTIDLTPYAKVVRQQPPQVELKQRTVFFRLVEGRYTPLDSGR